MGITAAQPRRGPCQSVPPAPNGISQYPIQSTPKFQQSKNQTAAGVSKSLTVTGTDSSCNQRAIPVSEVYFDMIQQDDEDEPDDDDDDDSDDYEDTEYDYRDEDVKYPTRQQPPKPNTCSSVVCLFVL